MQEIKMLQGAIIRERAFHSDIFLLIEESCWSANQAKSNRYYARNRLPAFGYRARKNLESYKITRIITILQDVSLMSSWNRQQLRRSVKDQQSKNLTIQERIPFAKLSFFQGSNTRSNGRKKRKTCNNFEEREYRGQRRRRWEIPGVFRRKKKINAAWILQSRGTQRNMSSKDHQRESQRHEQKTLMIIETNFFLEIKKWRKETAWKLIFKKMKKSLENQMVRFFFFCCCCYGLHFCKRLEWRRAKDEGGIAHEEVAAAAASERFVCGPVTAAPPAPETAGFLGRV